MTCLPVTRDFKAQSKLRVIQIASIAEKKVQLVPEGTDEALVDIIELFIATSAEECAQMSAQAILWARENFNLKLMGLS